MEDVEIAAPKTDAEIAELGDEGKARLGGEDFDPEAFKKERTLAGSKRPKREFSEEEDMDFEAIENAGNVAI